LHDLSHRYIFYALRIVLRGYEMVHFEVGTCQYQGKVMIERAKVEAICGGMYGSP